MKRFQSTTRAQKWVIALVMSPVFVAAAPAHGQDVEEAKIYVKMDYWKLPGLQSAEAWHFDPNNNNQWTQLSNFSNPNPPDLRGPRALFEVGELFDANLLLDNWIWFVELNKVDVVRGDPGSFQSVGNIPPTAG